MTEIDVKINELIGLIENEEAVKRYKEIEKALQDNEYVKSKLEEFRKWQRKMVIYEASGNKISDEINEKYDKLYNELLEIPILNEYLNLQQEINEMLHTITGIIEKEMNR
ncbi:MAG TPA: YlbF family regulator [Haloplasmataceae bacterium]